MFRTAFVALRYYGFLQFAVEIADYFKNRKVADVSISEGSDPVLSLSQDLAVTIQKLAGRVSINIGQLSRKETHQPGNVQKLEIKSESRFLFI